MQAQQKPSQPTTLKVVVLRAFQMAGGKVVPAKAEIELPRVFALEMIHANKAKAIEEPKEATTTAAAADKGGEQKRGGSNAR